MNKTYGEAKEEMMKAINCEDDKNRDIFASVNYDDNMIVKDLKIEKDR